MPQAPAPGQPAARKTRTASRGAWQYTWERVTGTDQRYIWRPRRTEEGHQFRADAGESRRWEDQTLEETSVQSCIRATAARFKTGAEARPRRIGAGLPRRRRRPAPAYSRPADKLRDAGEAHQLRAPPTHCLLIVVAPDCSRKSAQ